MLSWNRYCIIQIVNIGDWTKIYIHTSTYTLFTEKCPGVGLYFKQINNFIPRLLKFRTLNLQNRKVTVYMRIRKTTPNPFSYLLKQNFDISRLNCAHSTFIIMTAYIFWFQNPQYKPGNAGNSPNFINCPWKVSMVINTKSIIMIKINKMCLKKIWQNSQSIFFYHRATCFLLNMILRIMFKGSLVVIKCKMFANFYEFINFVIKITWCASLFHVLLVRK